jgi:quercetin dioxygenase-like cupin family protein
MLVRNVKDAPPIAYAEGVEKRVVIGPKDGAPNFVTRVFDLPPGTSSPYHTHDWEHEVFVLSGKGALVAEDSETPLGVNDAVLIPPDAKHCLRNKGQGVFRFICVVPLRGEDAT